MDILLVVDNSGSMYDKQVTLSNGFNSLIKEIQSQTEVNDYRIGVVTTDAYSINREGCQTLGALVDRTPKVDSNLSQQDLFTLFKQIFSGETEPEINQCLEGLDRPWLESDDDKLEERFSCLVKVGATGDGHERPLTAFRDSLQQKDCNKGFFREDSLLVTMLFTDEDATAPWEESLYDQIIEERNNLPNQVVVVSVANNNNSAILKKFTQRFPNYYFGNVFDSNYDQLYQQASVNMATACDAFYDSCPTNQCCNPSGIDQLLLSYGLPAALLFILGIPLGTMFAKKNVDELKLYTSGKFKGWSIGAISALTLATAFLLNLSKNCLTPMSWIYIAVLAMISLFCIVKWLTAKT